MRAVDEIEKAVRELSGDELSAFRRWFYEFDAKVWDAELEADARAGRLDEVAEAALAEYRAGRTRPL